MASELEVGKVGVGVAPTATLHVNSEINGADAIVENPTHNTQLLIKAAAVNKNSEILFGDSAADDVGKIDYDHNDNSLKLNTNSATRLTIDNTGNVGVGIAPDGSDWNANSKIVHAYQNDGHGAMFKAESISTSVVVSAASKGYIATLEAIDLAFWTNGSERLNISSTGLCSFSNGINLGNETLSVYRKGTFAPGLYYQNGSGVTIGGTAYASHGDSDYIKQVGQYVKVGNVVHVQIFIEAAIAGSIPNDNFGVQGLPFTSQNVTDDRCLLNAYTNGGGSVNHAMVSANSTVAVFETINGSGNLADDVGTGSNIRIHISGTYITS